MDDLESTIDQSNILQHIICFLPQEKKSEDELIESGCFLWDLSVLQEQIQ